MPNVDCETLLQPLPGESPEGDAAHFAMTLAPALRELRREESASDFDDASRPTQLKRADWNEVARRCEESLTTHAKDLRTACHLTEAWMRLEGLAGLSRGLEVVARLVGECWDRVTPSAGDDPAESRGVPLGNLLDDPDRGVCFPSLLRTLPLIGEGEHTTSYAEWTRLRAGRSTEDAERLDRLRGHTPCERLDQQHTDAKVARDRLDTLRRDLDERLGEYAPGLLSLRGVLDDLRGLLADELERAGFDVSAAAVETADDGADDKAIETPREPIEVAAALAPLGGDPNRDQLYTLLETTAERLRTMEPHSPIPYLIKRAVRLGRLPFPRLMEQVIREPSALSELNREFGIAEPDGAEVLA